jgi:hypothetical protein
MAENDVTFSRIPAVMAERWALVRAVCSSDEAALQKFLPYLNAKDQTPANQARNKAYQENAVLYNVTRHTREGLIGLAFSREPNAEGMPERLKYLLTDADGAGVSLSQQSQAALGSVLETGRHGLLVDFSEALSRPVIKAYQAEDIINWRPALIGGRIVLTMVVLHEMAEIDDGYAVTFVDQWREYRLNDGACICKVWQRPDPKKPPVQIGGDIAVRSPGRPFDSIPFRFIGAQNNDASIDDPPLYPLAYLNRHHFRNSADYEDSVFYVGQAQPWMSGLTEEWRDWMQEKGIYVGSRAPILLPAGGEFGFAQAQPNQLAMEAMKHKEEQMRALGARLVEEKTAHTATQSDNDKEASTSVLSTCVGNVTAGYQAAIDLCCRYMDTEPKPDAFAINKDFVRLLADAQTVTSMVDAWQRGVIAKADVRSFMRERSFVPPDRTDADIDKDIAAEPKPPAPAPNPAPAKGQAA